MTVKGLCSSGVAVSSFRLRVCSLSESVLIPVRVNENNGDSMSWACYNSSDCIWLVWRLGFVYSMETMLFMPSVLVSVCLAHRQFFISPALQLFVCPIILLYAKSLSLFPPILFYVLFFPPISGFFSHSWPNPPLPSFFHSLPLWQILLMCYVCMLIQSTHTHTFMQH